MASLKAIQSGTATILAANTSVNVTITAVVLAKSVLKYTYKGSGDRAARCLIRGTLTSTTNITFDRKTGSSATDFTINWQVIEFNDGIDVQRGTYSNVASTVNITISAVTIAQSFALLSIQGGFNFDNTGKERMTAEITSTTNLQLINAWDISNVSNEIAWQVINYTGASVQLVKRTHVDTATQEDVTITSTPMAHTAVFQTIRSNAGNFNLDSGEKLWLPYLEATTNLRYVRGSNNGGAGWGVTRVSHTFVARFPDVKVTRYIKDMDSGNTSSTQTVAIASTSRTTINNTSSVNYTVTYSQVADIDHPRWYTRGAITSTTVITWDRQVSGSQVTDYWELLEWDQKSGFLMFFEPF